VCFSSLKTLLMRRRLNASIAINVLAQFSMAGFEVTLHGRFWVTTEERPRHPAKTSPSDLPALSAIG